MAKKMTKSEAIAYGQKIHNECAAAKAEMREFEAGMMLNQGYSPAEIENFFAVRAVERNIALGLGTSHRVRRVQYPCCL